MPSAAPDVVVPNQPGLHVLLDGPQGQGADLTQRLAADALDADTATIVVLLDEAAPQFRAGLVRRGVDVEDAEATHRLQYVDAHAPRVGWAHTNPATVFAESPDADAILLALNEAQASLVEHAPQHQVLVSTLSTLLVLQGLNEAYQLMQALSSMAPRMGAVTIGHAVPGMHDEREVTALRHLATTVTDLRRSPRDAHPPSQGARDADPL